MESYAELDPLDAAYNSATRSMSDAAYAVRQADSAFSAARAAYDQAECTFKLLVVLMQNKYDKSIDNSVDL